MKKTLSIVPTIIIPLHLVFFSLIFFVDFTWISVLYLFLGYTLIGGLGVEVGLHRWASHKAVDLNRIAKPLVIFSSVLSCQGHAFWWAAVHRGNHHKHCDTEKDFHSPMHGKWNAFIGWFLKHDINDVNFKYVADLAREPLLKYTATYYRSIIYATWIIVGLISLNFLFWFLIIPTLIAFYSVHTINLICHSNFGYKNFNTNDNSKNVSVLGYLCWGNGWHNNHHYQASSYDFGKNVSGRSREFDPCMLLLPFIKK
jgi:stearoyl-CoA desaturase (delta-9 desaturase)